MVHRLTNYKGLAFVERGFSRMFSPKAPRLKITGTVNEQLNCPRKLPFLLALRRLGRFDVSPRETSPTAKSEEKRMFSQATVK